MRKRPLGGTGLEVTELALGTWGLCGDAYGPVPEAEQDAVIERALSMGIRLFDTADTYAEGKMEERLGRRLPNDRSCVVVTKVGTRRDTTPSQKNFTPEFLERSIEASAARLGDGVVRCVLLHNPSPQAYQRNDVGALMSGFKQRGLLHHWGVASGNVEVGRAALECGAEILELAYNIFHARELHQLEPEIAERNVGVLARSVLAHGLLTGSWLPNKEFPSTDHRALRWNTDELRHRIQQLNPIRTLLSQNLPSLRAIALRFGLEHARVSSVVLGPRNGLQLDQLVREAGREPPYIEPERLADLRTRLAVIGINL
ncbi:MAG TPA: aldo/keto reductase [Polyangiaceae bacterium]|nr:aldo/keto reductase [Polyangiaceae bacterium]